VSLAREAATAIPLHHKHGGTDHKAWAKRILWREEHRDPSLLSIQVKFAKQALDIKEEVRT
jgi:hypothetical protein